jgi:hypothetical protein
LEGIFEISVFLSKHPILKIGQREETLTYLNQLSCNTLSIVLPGKGAFQPLAMKRHSQLSWTMRVEAQKPADVMMEGGNSSIELVNVAGCCRLRASSRIYNNIPHLL